MIARAGVAAAVATAIALGLASLALGNYCIPHPAAEGCNVPRTGPRVTSATGSGDLLHLELTFHKAGRFVAHVKQDPPANPYGQDWGPRPTLGPSIPVGTHPAGPGRLTIDLEAHVAGRYGVIVVPANLAPAPGLPLDRAKVPSWVYFNERDGRAVDVRVLQP